MKKLYLILSVTCVILGAVILSAMMSYAQDDTIVSFPEPEIVIYECPIILESCNNDVIGTKEIIIEPAIEKLDIPEVVEINQFDSTYNSVKSELNECDIEMAANMMYGEAGALDDLQKSATLWCVLNRVDSGYGTLSQVITAKNQFVGYNPDRVYNSTQSQDLYEHCRELSADILTRYTMEKDGWEDVGRTLPKDYLYFYGKDNVNKFTKQWKNYDTIWDWSLPNPYEEED